MIYRKSYNKVFVFMAVIVGITFFYNMVIMPLIGVEETEVVARNAQTIRDAFMLLLGIFTAMNSDDE
jgi:hypothetical protein